MNLPDEITIQPNEGNGAPYHGYEGGDGVVYVPKNQWSTDMDAAPKDGTVVWVVHEHKLNAYAAFDVKVKKAQWLNDLEEWSVDGVGGNVPPILTHWRHIDLPHE